MGKNKNQHYLSAFYLYNFTNENQKEESRGKERRLTKIYHYDFDKGCVKERPIEKVAVDSYMFSFKDQGEKYDHSLDNELETVEVKAAKAIRELIDTKDYFLKKKVGSIKLDNLMMDDIIEFLFWQIKRHPDIVNSLSDECEHFLSNSGGTADYAKSMALDVVRNIGRYKEYDIYDEFQKKNKSIILTSSPFSQFITTDNPFVRMNKTGKNGISAKGTEMYFPLSSDMLLFLYGDGKKKDFRVENDRAFLRKLNIFMAKSAKKYIFARSDVYINKLVKQIS